MNQVTTHSPYVKSVKQPAETDASEWDDDQNAEYLGLRGNDHHGKFEHIHELIQQVLDPVNHASFCLADCLGLGQLPPG